MNSSENHELCSACSGLNKSHFTYCETPKKWKPKPSEPLDGVDLVVVEVEFGQLREMYVCDDMEERFVLVGYISKVELMAASLILISLTLGIKCFISWYWPLVIPL